MTFVGYKFVTAACYASYSNFKNISLSAALWKQNCWCVLTSPLVVLPIFIMKRVHLWFLKELETMHFVFGILVDSKISFESVNISLSSWIMRYVVIERLQFDTKGIKKTQA